MTTQMAIEIVPVECGECGCAFGMSETFYTKRREDHRAWYCPNGHSRSYKSGPKDREIAELTSALERQHEATREAWQVVEEKNKALRAARRRSAAGVCPCCNRTFTALQRHIANQHPDFAADAGVKVRAKERHSKSKAKA